MEQMNKQALAKLDEWNVTLANVDRSTEAGRELAAALKELMELPVKQFRQVAAAIFDLLREPRRRLPEFRLGGAATLRPQIRRPLGRGAQGRCAGAGHQPCRQQPSVAAC